MNQRVAINVYKLLYNSLIENSRDAIILFKKTQIFNANQAALDIFEVTKEDFIDHHIYEFTQDKESSIKRAENRTKGEAEFYTSEIKTASGIKEIEVSSTPINVNDITSFSIVRDVTEKNRTEKRHRTIIERSADLIFVIKNGEVVFINPRGVEYLGAETEDQILGNTSEVQIHPDYRELIEGYAYERMNGGNPPTQYRVKMLDINGDVLDVEFNVSLIEWDGEPSSLIIGRDIGNQIEYDKKLEELHRLATELLNLRDMQDIAELVVDAADKILGYKRIAFGIIRDNMFTLLRSKPPTNVMELPLQGVGITTRAIRSGTPQIVDDVRLDPDFVDSVMEGEAPTLSEYSMPIMLKGSPVALINIESEQVAAFDKEDTKLITILVDHITATLEKLE
ncbi:MAG: PAS domain S-box protein, partial [Candidatus Bathyarchaeota archaeon]|nr:PAS domain S-box protein [Candidatus Bathyarchaeota archaeon]